MIQTMDVFVGNTKKCRLSKICSMAFGMHDVIEKYHFHILD